MKLSTPLILTAVLLISVFAAYAQQDDPASVPRIPIAEVKRLMKTGDLVVLDVRGHDAYRAGHLPGAISFPLAEIPSRWKELPTDKTIVTYCS